MMTEAQVKERVEKLRQRILDPRTKSNIREAMVNQLRAFEQVLQEGNEKIVKRLEDAGI